MATDVQATDTDVVDSPVVTESDDPAEQSMISEFGDIPATSDDTADALTSEGDTPESETAPEQDEPSPEADQETEGDEVVPEAEPEEEPVKVEEPTDEDEPSKEAEKEEPVTETDIEVDGFPFTVQFGDKPVTFETEEAYDTFVENAENQAKAWTAIHEKNRELNVERVTFEQERIQHEQEVVEARTAALPQEPDVPDFENLDPESDVYNPKEGFAQLKQYLLGNAAFVKAMAVAPSAAPEGELPNDRLKREIGEAETSWYTAHPDLTETQRNAIDTTANRLATERMKALADSGYQVRPDVDVPHIYDQAFAEVTGKEATAREADPSESLRSVTRRVIRIAQQRGKTSPKRTQAVPSPDQTTVDPMGDKVSQEDFDKLLAAGKIEAL